MVNCTLEEQQELQIPASHFHSLEFYWAKYSSSVFITSFPPLLFDLLRLQSLRSVVVPGGPGVQWTHHRLIKSQRNKEAN